MLDALLNDGLRNVGNLLVHNSLGDFNDSVHVLYLRHLNDTFLNFMLQDFDDTFLKQVNVSHSVAVEDSVVHFAGHEEIPSASIMNI